MSVRKILLHNLDGTTGKGTILALVYLQRAVDAVHKQPGSEEPYRACERRGCISMGTPLVGEGTGGRFEEGLTSHDEPQETEK